ncbi:hypothetical protein DFH27DRAFT_59898 [Peziza echinospora]|nr:hypothetical protein DFH27DRAFT_59898 [Peziza echinospora]
MNEIGNPGPFSKQHEIGNSGPFSKQLDIDLSEGISLFLAKYPDYSTTGSIGTAGSHNVILIVPTNETQQDVTVSILYYTRLATPYIGGKLAELALKHYRQQGRILYQHLFNIPQARTSAGWIFESLVHARLRRGGQMEFIPLARQQLEAPTIINLKKARELQTAAPFHNHSDLNALLREHPESRKPTGKLGILDTYLRPTTASFASIDGLAILSHNYRLVLFQITISADHPISGSGLQKLWDSLPDELRQRNCRGVYFVWVIPRPNEDKSFKVQRITGNEKSEWEQRLIQLRISFEDDDLWCSGG